MAQHAGLRIESGWSPFILRVRNGTELEKDGFCEEGEDLMVRTVDARTARREFMVKDKKDQIFNVDMETHFQRVASTNDGSSSTEMVTNQTIRMEDGRLLSLEKDGTFRALSTGEIFEVISEDE